MILNFSPNHCVEPDTPKVCAFCKGVGFHFIYSDFFSIRLLLGAAITMMEWFLNFITNLLPAFLVAAFTAIITVRLSIRRFYAERWWERKADAYSLIVESLHHLIEYCDARAKEYLEGVKYTEEKDKQLSDDYSAAYCELRKATGIGAYIIDSKAAKVLYQLDKRPKLDWDNNPPWEIFEKDSNAYKDALAEISQIAKRDLGVK